MSSYDALWKLLPELVDEELGIISHVFPLARQADMPNVHYYKATVANTGVFDGPENFAVAGGTSLSEERAKAKAVGEAVERYSSAIYHYDALPLASVTAQENSLPPDNWGGCYGQNWLEKAAHIHWSKAKDLSNGKEVFVPSALVYCPYEPNQRAGEEYVAEQISTGLASHLTEEAAQLNGLMEVVERDAFMQFWLSSWSPPQIEKNSLDAAHLMLIERLEEHGYSISLLDIRSDNRIPTVLGVMRGTRAHNVPVLFAAATHLDPSMAVLKCLEELALIERYAKRIASEDSSFPDYKNADEVKYLIDHIAFWFQAGRRPHLEFVTASAKTIDLSAIPNWNTEDETTNLKRAVDLVEGTGHRIVAADCTSEDVASLGFHVTRVLVPGYLPLNKEHVKNPIHAERLLKLLTETGRPLNPFPHPFA